MDETVEPNTEDELKELRAQIAIEKMQIKQKIQTLIHHPCVPDIFKTQLAEIEKEFA